MEKQEKKFGALKIFLDKKLSSFILASSEFAYFSLKVSSFDIPTENESHLDFIPLTEENFFSNLYFEKIPYGTDRIVSLFLYSAEKIKLKAFTVRAVVNIDKSENEVLISDSTTAFGNVLFGIKDIYNFEVLEKDGRMQAVRNVIDDSVPPVLYDSAKLIGELQGFSFPWNAKKSDYVLKTGQIEFDYLLSENFSVSINDPLSENLENQKASCGLKISGIAPGNWLLSVKDSSGRLLEQNEISIKSGECFSAGHLTHDGIALFIEKKSGLEIPSENNKKEIKLCNLPAEKFSFLSENFSEKDFYLYDFEKTSSLSFELFFRGKNTCGSEELFKSREYSVSRKGIYFVTEKALISADFDKNLEAKPIDNLPITEENLKKCFIDDEKNQRFVLLFNSAYYKRPVFSVKADFTSGINDCDGDYKGKTYEFTKSDKGFWYASVPYSDLQATNQCGQPSYNFKINGKMIEPPEFVPDGYIYQKFYGSCPVQKFLVLIYSSQKEKEITRRLTESKKCRKLKDFNLESQEGQREIANFRLVPGTKNLYRSYHPYKDDKVEISDTSFERMKYVAELAEKAGIVADINLSDYKQTDFTYSMPAYYQRIIENDKVLYMTDCTYSVCYERTDSDEFCGGLEKIADFVNENDGPYQIHCAIGTDRTGIVCAVISGLCGASLQQIEEDYCASIKMGIFEYRGPGAVLYSLKKLLGVASLKQVGNLQKSLLEKLSQNDENRLKKFKKLIERLTK